MQGEPCFMSAMQQLASTADPPVYASQGADVGRTRGRKPKSNKTKGKNEKSKKGKKGKATKACKVKTVRKTKKAKRVTATGKSSDSPKKKTSPRKTTKRRRVGKFHKLDTRPATETVHSVARGGEDETGGSEAPGADDQPCHHGPRRVPPPHITPNHVYSSAYRRNKAYGQEYAREAGKLAAASFREFGYVDDLCGVFRATQRAKVQSSTGDECKDI
eukprot:s534_g9.t1